MKKVFAGLTAIALSVAAAPIFPTMAQTDYQPTDGAIGMLRSNSSLADEVGFFHNMILLPIITVITLFVLALLIIVVVKYNSKSNPVPKKFSHNTLVEVLWTGVPIIILLAIALPSFDLLYKEDVVPDGKQVVARGDGATTGFSFKNDFSKRRVVSRPDHIEVWVSSASETRKLKQRDEYSIDGLGEADVRVTLTQPITASETLIIRGGRTKIGRGAKRAIALAPTMTLKVSGFQWGWSYSYPDFGDFEFVSNMAPREATTPELYLFEVDNRIVVPVGETIRVMTTARDVIHSFALPNFALKIDAVPGRINETWFNADNEGVFYGQCSEICGIRHSFMPIAVEVVSRPAFEAWVDRQRALAGMDPMFSNDAGQPEFAEARAATAPTGK